VYKRKKAERIKKSGAMIKEKSETEASDAMMMGEVKRDHRRWQAKLKERKHTPNTVTTERSEGVEV